MRNSEHVAAQPVAGEAGANEKDSKLTFLKFMIL
jgi:hypothetical protein